MSSEIKCQVETSILNSILIDCCVVFLQENSSEEKILGSGTLVSIHDKKAILTADHVLEKIDNHQGADACSFLLALTTHHNPLQEHRHKFQMKYLEKRTVVEEKKKTKGQILVSFSFPMPSKANSFLPPRLSTTSRAAAGKF